MSDNIIVGTVRGRNRDGSFVVVQRNGTAVDVHFRGTAPANGSDVIGNLGSDEAGRATMTLQATVLDAILDGHAKIAPISKRSDLTARALARILERSKSAVFKPGAGMAIERMPHSDDPDLSWAMNAFRPEADRLGLALNVIDVKAVTRSPWDMRSLQNFALPADIEGSRRTKDELTRILRSGFHPACSRIVERLTGNNEISVNFVLPYSPFVGAVGFARQTAQMDVGGFPLVSMNISEARRLSSARQMAVAIAHNRLGVGKGFQADVDSSPRVRHLTNCFADAAASLAFLASGGRIEVIEEYALLKEASLLFGYDQGQGGLRPGVLETATHRTLQEVLQSEIEPGAPIKRIVSEAVQIAKRTALPGIRFAGGNDVTEPEMEGAVNAANMIAADLRSATREYVEHLSEKYRDDLDALVAEHGTNLVAGHRLMTFGSAHVPERMELVFGELTDGIALAIEEATARERAEQETAIYSTVADRFRAATATKVMDLEFEEAPAFLLRSPGR